MTPDIEEYVYRRVNSLEKNLRNFLGNRIIAIFVEIARTTKHHRHGNVFYAKGMLTLPGKTIRATHTDIGIHAAIDGMKEKLKGEIRNYKERVGSKRRGLRKRSSLKSIRFPTNNI